MMYLFLNTVGKVDAIFFGNILLTMLEIVEPGNYSCRCTIEIPTFSIMAIVYIFLRYIWSGIKYFNILDSRLGESTWRWSYDYPVIGERDISDLDDKNFVRLRRKRNKIITVMYSVVLIMFLLSMSLLSEILIFFLT